MKKLCLWVCVGLLLLVSGVVLTALLEPTQTVRGYFAGDAFYRDRPTRYWRKVLREEGQRGTVSRKIVVQFHDVHGALPILRECARDPDRNVRWPAITVLGHNDGRSEQILSVLIAALNDNDVEVRLQAIDALARWGTMARSAIPALAARLNDSELQVAHAADFTLWDIDQPSAVKVCGWQPFTSERWRFSVIVPSEPEEAEQPILDLNPLVAHTFTSWHRVGREVAPTNYLVAVREYAEESLQLMKREDIVAEGQKQVLQTLGGKLVREQPVVQHGSKGVEYVIEVATRGTMRSRFFWSGRRLYQVQVVGKPLFLNTRAADYFLDSFRLVEGPAQKVP